MINTETSTPPPPRSRLLTAGWICFGVGLLTFWILGLGLLGLLAAFVIGMIEICQKRQGASALVASSAFAIPICIVLCMILLPVMWIGVFMHQQRALQYERLTSFINPRLGASPSMHPRPPTRHRIKRDQPADMVSPAAAASPADAPSPSPTSSPADTP